MAIRSLLTKGIGSLLKRKPKPKPNRRLTPEEIAERKAKAQEEVLGEYMRYKYASPVRSPDAGRFATFRNDMYKMDDDLYAMTALSPGSTAMRAKKVGDETMEMIKDSVMKMDLPEAKKAEAIKSAATAIRNATPAELARMDPSVLVKNFMSKYGPYIGIGVGYGVADNKEAIGDMLKAVKLPTGIDIEMTPAGDIFGGGEDVEEPSFGTKTGEFLMDWLQPLPREWGQVDPKIKID